MQLAGGLQGLELPGHNKDTPLLVDDGREDDDEPLLTGEEITRQLSAFTTLILPVVMTMVLASWCVVHINDPSDPNPDAGVSSYQAFSPGAGQPDFVCSAVEVNAYSCPKNVTASCSAPDKQLNQSVCVPSECCQWAPPPAPSTGAEVAAAAGNAAVIIGVVAGLTFVIVLLYYMNCMWLLYGYMFLSSTMLLGLLGGLMWRVAVYKWNCILDWATFYIVCANFALVGVIAIFYQKGTPMGLTQSYLVCISVIMAWQLKQLFPVWTTFALLIGLALYDLCAVLTPCGPLKLLVGLVQKEGRPLPGLLYEADR
eukprot:g3120.t1